MININTGFKMGSAEPIDGRMVLTSEEMTTMNDNIMPEVYLATNKDDGQLYLYNKTNEPDPTTGKFRIMSGGDAAIELTLAEYNALKEAGELKPDTNYFVKDAEIGGGIVEARVEGSSLYLTIKDA